MRVISAPIVKGPEMSINPDEKWSLERLGDFCSRSQKRLAVEAWRFGHALNLARDKQAHGDWQKWKQKYVPNLTRSSEHRCRNLAKRLPEDALDGMGLTEAYRLLDLTHTKGERKKRDDPFPQAPRAVLVGSGALPPDAPPVASCARDSDEDKPDDTDNSAVSPLPRLDKWFPATGLMEIERETALPRVATGLMECEPECAAPLVVPSLVGERSPGDQYRLYLLDARHHLEALQSWADWLERRGEGFRYEMWDKHEVRGARQQIEKTVERLRWVAENLEWW